MDRTGQCLCGAVSFVARGVQPDKTSACHCGMCLRWAGGPWISMFVESIDVSKDEGLTWTQTSTLAQRGFCSACGSSLFWRLTAEGKYQGTTSVSLGCLDDKTGVRLIKEWFIDNKPDAYSLAGERECITEAEAFAFLDDGA
jgi:hypothetical protein